MSLLFETIKVFNSRLFNLEYHNERVNRSRYKLFKQTDDWDLANLIKLPELNPGEIYKCRFTYSDKPGKIEIIPYQFRKITSMRLVEDHSISYALKYNDRSALDRIKLANNDVDEVIVVQNGRLTDCTFANLVFFDGIRWVTPWQTLLNGTKRQKYINESVICTEDIYISDLARFSSARLINAMIDLEDGNDIKIENIQMK